MTLFFFTIIILEALTRAYDVAAGRTGVVTLSHFTFVAVGAYTTAVITRAFTVPLLWVVMASVILGYLTAMLFALTTRRLRGDGLIVASIGLQMAALDFARQADWLTGGSKGLIHLKVPTFLGQSFTSSATALMLAVVVSAITAIVVLMMYSSRASSILSLVQESELLSRSFGISPSVVRGRVLVLSSVVASAIGCAYAIYQGSIEPTFFRLEKSVEIAAVLVIGGAATGSGPLLGAAGYVVLKELVAIVSLPAQVVGHVHSLLFSVLVLGCLLAFPAGLAGQAASRSK